MRIDINPPLSLMARDRTGIKPDALSHKFSRLLSISMWVDP